MKVGFIGLGKLGLTCAEAMADKHEVTGYDINDRISDKINVVTDLDLAVSGQDIVFVAVQTPHHPEYDGSKPTAHLPNKDFNYDQVKQVLTEINNYAEGHALVVLISTVLPGTTRRELAPIITNANFIYNPYLIAMGSIAWDMVNPEMVIIGTNDGSETGDARKLLDFYKTIMENDPRYAVGTYEEAESIKIFYNTFISAKLSLVNMIQDVSLKIGHINVDIVTDALAKSTKRIMGPQYMTAGMGDGGACHPRDNIALRWMAEELDLGYDLFDSIMNAREKQAKNMAEFLINLAEEHDLPVLMHGIAYKPGVPYLDGSYSLLVSHYLNEKGFNPIMIDPLSHPDPGPYKAIVLLAHNASTTYQYTNQNYADEMYCEVLPGSVIVDPWRKFSKENNDYTVIHYGNTR
tara:strand:- start:31 stop:1248 length:1218 start_codon:yes stop_codon:yes gene_type:complete